MFRKGLFKVCLHACELILFVVACVDRSRWVVYKDTFDYNPTQIPPEWHGWVNYINDFPPTTYKYDQPKYMIDSFKTRTGRSGVYDGAAAGTAALPRGTPGASNFSSACGIYSGS
jgi:NADH:ubiquinone oxidoreductase subunit